jgi:hypothetical protein
MTSIEDKVGKLLRVPFAYSAYMEVSDPLGMPSIRLEKDDLIVLISCTERDEPSWEPGTCQVSCGTNYLTLKVLTNKGKIALMTVSEGALTNFWKISV